MKRFTNLLLCLTQFLVVAAFGQKHEIGLSLNAFNYQGDISLIDAPYLPETRPGFGLFYRNTFHNNFGVRLGGALGTVRGDDQNFDERKENNPSIAFETRFINLGANLEWNILGRERRNLRLYDADGQRIPYEELGRRALPVFDADGNQLASMPRLKRSVVPYLTAGLGASFFNPEVTITSPDNRTLSQKELDQDFSKIALLTPFGGGFKFYLSEKWVLGLEALLIPTHTDYFDGVSDSRNPRENDVLSTLSLGISYRWGVRDRDGDGVPDNVDRCPDQPGPAALAGCPDSDGDGIPDIDDLCPNEPGPASTGGCPDRDGDGIADKDDRCPDEAGPAKFAGCPDRDGDGIPDIDDRCPDEAGPAELAGCPDRDGDGIPDIDDRCPDEAGPASTRGCPDRDGDGVADIDDKCPDQPGPASNFGCPEITKEDQEKIEFAIKNVNFRTARATLTNASRGILDDLAVIMGKYPAYHLSIEGHTDNKGRAEFNQKLSADRAKACFDYLVSKGVPAERMSHQGFGPSRPIASNDTEEGRAENRRTNFLMVVK
jgi:OOP family OmpA-OmpF porin